MGAWAVKALTCDFCCKLPAVVTFAQRKSFVIVLVNDDGDTQAQGYASPWACCSVCQPMVMKKQIHLLLERAKIRIIEGEELNRHDRRAQRAVLKKLYQGLFKVGLKPPTHLA